MDSAKKDPEEERKILEYIRNEFLRGQDPKSVRLKLIQAGWEEPVVLRLIETATAKPDFKVAMAERVNVLDIEQALVFQKDGNLRLQRDIIDGQRRKKRTEDEFLALPKPLAEIPKTPPLTPEEWARIIRVAAHLSLGGLLVYHAFLLGERYLG